MYIDLYTCSAIMKRYCNHLLWEQESPSDGSPSRKKYVLLFVLMCLELFFCSPPCPLLWCCLFSWFSMCSFHLFHVFLVFLMLVCSILLNLLWWATVWWVTLAWQMMGPSSAAPNRSGTWWPVQWTVPGYILPWLLCVPHILACGCLWWVL